MNSIRRNSTQLDCLLAALQRRSLGSYPTACAAVLSATLALVGCGEPKGGPRLKVVPIEGEVSLDGEVPHEAMVNLHPVTPHVMPREGQVIASLGQVDEAGKFTISTYILDDGAPPGDYKITVTWNEATGVMKNAWDGPDRLKGKYADVEKTEFQVTVPEEHDGVFVIPPLELTMKKRR